MTQPKDLPSFATDANYSSGPATGTPVRAIPVAPQGIVPGQPVYAQHHNALLGLALDHLAALAAMPALNWTVTRSFADGDAGGAPVLLSVDWLGTRPVIASGVDDNYAPTLMIQDIGTRETFSSRDGTHWILGGSMAAAPDPFIGIATFETFPWFGGITEAGASEESDNAGANWFATGALPSANDWQAVAADQHGSRVVAFGKGKGATAVVTLGLLGAWSALTLPGDWAGFAEDCRYLYTPAKADTAVGFMVLAAGVRDWILWSADGVTWVQVTTPTTTQWAGATWSESRQRWYLISLSGELAESVSADPTDEFVLLSTPDFATDLTGIAYHGITTVGRYLVIFGKNLSTVGGPRGGNVVITDLELVHTLSIDQGVWVSSLTGSDTDDATTTAFTVPIRFDGRVGLVRWRPIWDNADTIDCAFSMRLPWELNG